MKIKAIAVGVLSLSFLFGCGADEGETTASGMPTSMNQQDNDGPPPAVDDPPPGFNKRESSHQRPPANTPGTAVRPDS